MTIAPGSCRKDADGHEAVAAAAELRAELIAAEREYIYRLLQDGKITDEARRRIERELDLEEESLAFKRGASPTRRFSFRWRFALDGAARLEFLPLGNGVRAARPHRKFIRIVIEPLRQAPKRPATRGRSCRAFFDRG